MRLEQYLTEGRGGRTKSIDQEAALDFIRKKCKKAWNHYVNDGKVLYRSSETYTERFGVVEPARFKRVSRYTRNYYTLMLDNMPQWSKFPKRSKSLIGASDFQRAGDHVGTTYAMFPVDGTSIGVCPTDDLWTSFGTTGYRQMDEFNNDFRDILRKHSIPDPNNWKEMLKVFENIDEVWDRDTFAFNIIAQKLDMYKNLKAGKGLYDACSVLLDPDGNNFRIAKIGDRLPTNVEVWWQTKTIMVKADLIKNIKEMGLI